MTKYKDISKNSLPEIEKRIAKYWVDEDSFKKSIAKRKNSQQFTFFDGPPFANGLPHYGHLLTGFIKDIFARFQTMKGCYVPRVFGWDCHGLPAEMGAEKELGLSGRLAIEQYGIAKFNDHCRSSVMQYSAKWEEYVNRQGRWVDFAGGYKTMDLSYMESVISAFHALYNKGLIYEDLKVMPYSWACETVLSNFETKLDNAYRKKESKAITVKFQLTEPLCGYGNVKILAWTTTPWTLPSNLALAVGSDIDYLLLQKDNDIVIIAKALKEKYKELADYLSIKEIKGLDLLNLKYKPLFDYFSDEPNAFRILSGDFVTIEDGTGIVHLAPGFGEDDMALCKANNIAVLCPVDNSGKFTEIIKDYAGKHVFDANDEIIKHLKSNGTWLKTEQYIHDYPHCWRTDTPLIYKAVSSWYVKVSAFKDRMVELNREQINWIPSHIKDGLFGKWLENARDWAISRNRFWGCPIPIWRSLSSEKIKVFGSLKEINEFFNIDLKDLHKSDIDQPFTKDGEIYQRVPDVLDCWFESGSMPFAQYGLDARLPLEKPQADFIVEYSAQTRGWFYTLMVLSTALFDRAPFLNCICHGVILDEKGQKLSKRLNNYADPLELFDKYGSDSMRWFMARSAAMTGSELQIDKNGEAISAAYRASLQPIINSYNFFSLYANADDSVKPSINYDSKQLLDQYILYKLTIAVSSIDEALTNYNTTLATAATEEFFDILTNWYIRRSRSCFWGSGNHGAYNTLYTVLVVMMRSIAPLAPFLAEEIHLALTGESVHLADFPSVPDLSCYKDIAKKMDLVRDICHQGLALREENKVRVRQPLKPAVIYCTSVFLYDNSEYKCLIMYELNVENVIYRQWDNSKGEEKLKINARNLAPLLSDKNQMKQIIAAAAAGDWRRDGDCVEVADFRIKLGDAAAINLVPSDPSRMKAVADGLALLELDFELTEKLVIEGWVRDMVREIQNDRKNRGLAIADRIPHLIIICHPSRREAIKSLEPDIKISCLIDEISYQDFDTPSFTDGSDFKPEDFLGWKTAKPDIRSPNHKAKKIDDAYRKQPWVADMIKDDNSLDRGDLTNNIIHKIGSR